MILTHSHTQPIPPAQPTTAGLRIHVNIDVQLLPDSMLTGFRLNKTGRQWLTQQTIWALLNWMRGPVSAIKDLNNQLLCHTVTESLGPVTPLKARYVRLMLAGLTCDRKTMKIFRPGLLKKELVHMICTLDQFGLTYRSDINRILKSIGELPLLETGTEADEFTLKHPSNYTLIS